MTGDAMEVLLRLIQIIKVRTAAFDLGKSLLFFSRLPFGSQQLDSHAARLHTARIYAPRRRFTLCLRAWSSRQHQFFVAAQAPRPARRILNAECKFCGGLAKLVDFHHHLFVAEAHAGEFIRHSRPAHSSAIVYTSRTAKERARRQTARAE